MRLAGAVTGRPQTQRPAGWWRACPGSEETRRRLRALIDADLLTSSCARPARNGTMPDTAPQETRDGRIGQLMRQREDAERRRGGFENEYQEHIRALRAINIRPALSLGCGWSADDCSPSMGSGS